MREIDDVIMVMARQLRNRGNGGNAAILHRQNDIPANLATAAVDQAACDDILYFSHGILIAGK